MERSKFGPCQGKRDDTEVGMHGGVGGAVSEDDDGISEPDGETGGDGTVGWMGQVICIYPYVPLTRSKYHKMILKGNFGVIDISFGPLVTR